MPTLNLEEYLDKKVTIQVKDGDDDMKELTGKVDTVNAFGLLLKNGQALDLVEVDDILDIEPFVEGDKKVTQRWIKEVELGQYRRHLADRHALTLETVNAMSEETAEAAHDAIDHGPLSHEHGEKPKRANKAKKPTDEREQAIADAEAAHNVEPNDAPEYDESDETEDVSSF